MKTLFTSIILCVSVLSTYAQSINGTYHLVQVSDSKNTDFYAQVASRCNKYAVWEISSKSVNVILPNNCNEPSYSSQFSNGFTYIKRGNILTLIDAPNSNILDGTAGGAVEFKVNSDGNTMSWELIKKARYNDPNYTYRWVFKRFQAID